LKENFSFQIKMDKKELHCVQCGVSYAEAHNGDGSCKFHTQSKWGRNFQCCNQNNEGCQTSKHRNEHHCDYKYYAFIEQVSQVLNYTDANKEWSIVEDSNILSQTKLYCQVGVVTKGIWKDRLFVVFNTRWNFYTFTVDDIKSKFHDVSNDSEKLIKEFVEKDENDNKNNESEGGTMDVKDFSRASWRIEGGKITGISIMCQSKTSPNPEHCVVEFRINNNHFEHVKNTSISHGGIVEYKPNSPYKFPIPDDEFRYEGAILENNSPYERYRLLFPFYSALTMGFLLANILGANIKRLGLAQYIEWVVLVGTMLLTAIYTKIWMVLGYDRKNIRIVHPNSDISITKDIWVSEGFDTIERKENTEKENSEKTPLHEKKVEVYEFIESRFKLLLIISAVFVAFAHGANDVANSVGPYSVVFEYITEGTITADYFGVPIYIYIICGLGIDIGLLVLGQKVMKTVGNDITKLDFFKCVLILKLN